MSDRERELASLRLQRRNQYARENRTTDAPLSFMFDVDPAWASEYVMLSQQLNHLPFMNDILHVSPRVVRIALLKPHRLIKLLDRKWSADDQIEGAAGKLMPWAEYREEAMRQWQSPMTHSWFIAELSEAAECFSEGMSPLEAMMDIHSDCADGEENRPITSPFSSPLGVICSIVVIALAAIALKIYMASSTAHAIQLIHH